jgi:hypothetical protein
MDQSERESDERFVAEFEALYAAEIGLCGGRVVPDVIGTALQTAVTSLRPAACVSAESESQLLRAANTDLQQ